eukprot:3565761-Prymnesium_polylepis.1
MGHVVMGMWWAHDCASGGGHMAVGASRAHRGHITCASRAPHVRIACASRAPHVRLTCASRAPHVRIACVSRAPHVRIACASRAHHVRTSLGGRAVEKEREERQEEAARQRVVALPEGVGRVVGRAAAERVQPVG